MRKLYDDFLQLKLKDMSKTVSDRTYKYINTKIDTPTKVPSIHYEKLLDKVAEKYVSDVTGRQFLMIMYTQLLNLKKEDERYFYQALICLDLALNSNNFDAMEDRVFENKLDYKNS